VADPHVEYYDLMRVCLLDPPRPDLMDGLAERARDPSLGAAHPDLGRGWQRIAEFVAAHPGEEARDCAAKAYRILLGHPFSPKLEPYASHYLEGSRFGSPLVRLRRFLADWGLLADREQFRDLEDHAAFLFDCLAQIKGLEEREGERWAEAFEICLRDHVLPWVPRFLGDLERADDALGFGGFYAGLARIARAILDLDAKGVAQSSQR
jgi:TorA maturation chaperone TorD